MNQIDRVQAFVADYIKGPPRDLLIVARDWRGAMDARDSLLRIPGAERRGVSVVRFENGTAALVVGGRWDGQAMAGFSADATLIHSDAGYAARVEAIKRTERKNGRVEIWVTP